MEPNNVQEESKTDFFKKREDDVVNRFISEIEDKHFLDELGPGGYWKIKEGMKTEFSICEEMKDLIEDATDTISFLESELSTAKKIIRELLLVAQHANPTIVEQANNLLN